MLMDLAPQTSLTLLSLRNYIRIYIDIIFKESKIYKYKYFGDRKNGNCN